SFRTGERSALLSCPSVEDRRIVQPAMVDGVELSVGLVATFGQGAGERTERTEEGHAVALLEEVRGAAQHRDLLGAVRAVLEVVAARLATAALAGADDDAAHAHVRAVVVEADVLTGQVDVAHRVVLAVDGEAGQARDLRVALEELHGRDVEADLLADLDGGLERVLH